MGIGFQAACVSEISAASRQIHAGTGDQNARIGQFAEYVKQPEALIES